MSLEKSTPYRNAWYRDLLEKEAELKQYTDEKVAQAIELPEVTSEDNGDILQVIEGAWAKGSAPKELPEVTSEDNGKVAGVVDGSWSTMDIPNELPAVTSVDNGKVLGVTGGAWGVADIPSNIEIFKVNNSSVIENNKTIGDIVSAIESGKDVILVRESYSYNLIKDPESTTLTFITIDGYRVYTMGFNRNNTSSNTIFKASDYVLTPKPTQANKTLKSDISSGSWVEADFPEPLKSVQFVNGQALSDADYALIKANTNVRGIYSDASKYIIFDLSSCNFMQTEFEFVNYAERLKANIGTNKVVTITQIPIASSPIPISSSNSINAITVEGSLL